MQDKYEAFELLPMLLVGILGGLLGSLFNHLNKKITRWRKQYVTRNWQKMLDAAAVAMLSATLCFILPLTVACRVCLLSVQLHGSVPAVVLCYMCVCVCPEVSAVPAQGGIVMYPAQHLQQARVSCCQLVARHFSMPTGHPISFSMRTR